MQPIVQPQQQGIPQPLQVGQTAPVATNQPQQAQELNRRDTYATVGDVKLVKKEVNIGGFSVDVALPTFEDAEPDMTKQEKNAAYNAILAHRLNPWSDKFLTAVKTKPFLLRRFHRDLTERVTWENDPWKDYWSAMKNNHKAMGMFTAHPDHPFSRSERFIVFMCGVCCSLFVAGIMRQIDKDEGTYLDCSYGGSAYGGYGSDCVEMYDDSVESSFNHYLLLFVFSLLTNVFMTILKNMATCKNAQSCNNTVRSCVECMGKIVMFIQAVLAIILLVLGIVYGTSENGSAFFEEFLIAQGSSMFYDIFIIAALFAWTRRGELKKEEKEPLPNPAKL
jgi:hypothetical protein